MFASEIKALLEDQQQERAINEESLYHYLSFHVVPAPATLFEGIHKLSPGTWLRINEDGQVRECRYWDVWDHTTPLSDVSEGEIAERIITELRTSVKLRKISDVPVGVFLSGGIDSSTNAALFSEGETKPIETFSIGYDRDYRSYANELHYARKMAGTVGARHHELLLNETDVLEFIPHMVRQQDEPIADPVCVPLYFVSKLARDCGVIVCQVGEGSDELFWGYPYWKTILQLQRYANRLPVPGAIRRFGLPALDLLTWIDRSSRRSQYGWEIGRRALSSQPLFWGGFELFFESQKRRLLSQRLYKKFAGLSSWEVLRPIHERFEQKSWEKSDLHWMSYLDLSLRLPELLLMRVDKMSMAVGLEARVPFLDHKFVELAMSIPQSIKTKNGVLKSILKKAVRGIIPDQLIDRKKQGFGVPVRDWHHTNLGGYVSKQVQEFCRQTDLLDWKGVLPLLPSNGWALLNLALWWEHYIGSHSTADPGVPKVLANAL